MTEDRTTTPDGGSDAPGLPHDANDLPAVTNRVDASQIKQFATQIKSAEHQIGEHILTSLQDPETVAVVTAVVAVTWTPRSSSRSSGCFAMPRPSATRKFRAWASIAC